MTSKTTQPLEIIIKEVLIALLITGCTATKFNPTQIFQKYSNKPKTEYVLPTSGQEVKLPSLEKDFSPIKLEYVKKDFSLILPKYIGAGLVHIQPKYIGTNSVHTQPKYVKGIKSRQLSSKEIEHYLDVAFNQVKIPNYISKDYVRHLINVESSWNPNAKSKSGAKGLGQIMDQTWKTYETKVPYEEGVFIPETNLKITLKHLKWQDSYFRKFYPNWENVPTYEKLNIQSAAYNVGINRLQKSNWNISKMPKETINHVQKMNKN